MTSMPCAAQREVPWSVFLDPETKQQRLVAVDEDEDRPTTGLVGLTVHKKAMDPNQAVEMPGVPKTAPHKLVAQLAKQDKLLGHIAKLENKMIKTHKAHQDSRRSWIALETKVVKMAPGPNKLQSENLLLKLAKEMSKEDVKGGKKGSKEATKVVKASPVSSDSSVEPKASVKKAMDTSSSQDATANSAIKKLKKMGGRAAVKKMLVAKMRSAAQQQEAADKGNAQAEARDHLAEEMAPKFVKAMMDKVMPKPGSGNKPEDTIDGIPVGHRKCFQRACIKKDADGNCAAAVISCGDAAGHAPKDMSKLSKKKALEAAKKDMGPMFKGLGDMAHASTLEQLQEVMSREQTQADAAAGFLGRLSEEPSV